MHVRHSLVNKKNSTKLRGFTTTDVFSRPFRCKIKTSCDKVTFVVPWRYFEYLPFHCVTNVQRANQSEERIWRPPCPKRLSTILTS